ncbi:MAG: pyrroline-5-carboxylate reductase [Pirellulales bacterium]
MLSPRIGFLGAGKMAAALAGGFVRAGLVRAEALSYHDPVEAAATAFQASAGGKSAKTNREVAAAADVLFLAVKPQQVAAVVGELKGHAAGKLVVSVAAGVTLQALQHGLGEGARVVRVMPNTPCLVGKGASAFALGSHATADDGELVQKLLESVGSCYRLDEKLLDAVTGLSGSGPAFVYVMIEALADGGVRMGLPRDVALGLAASTVFGAAAMVLETKEHPGRLKDQVTSPGGTTIAGLQALEVGAVRGDLISAVEAATRRSIELGKGA